MNRPKLPGDRLRDYAKREGIDLPEPEPRPVGPWSDQEAGEVLNQYSDEMWAYEAAWVELGDRVPEPASVDETRYEQLAAAYHAKMAQTAKEMWPRYDSDDAQYVIVRNLDSRAAPTRHLRQRDTGRDPGGLDR